MRAAARLGEVAVDGDDVWWSESRPAEGGRSVIVRRAADGTVSDVAARALERPHPGARVRRRRLDRAGRRRAGSPSSPTSGCTDSTPARDTPVAVTARAGGPAGRRTRICASAAGLLAVREAPRRGRGRRRRQRDRRVSSTDGCRGAGLRSATSCPRRGWPRRRDAGVAAVGPPEHAVGRHRARRPPSRRRAVRARARRRRRRGSRSSSPSGATTVALWFSDRTGWSNLYRRRPHEQPSWSCDAGGGHRPARSGCSGRAASRCSRDGRVAFAYGRDGADGSPSSTRRQPERAGPALHGVYRRHGAGDRGGCRGGHRRASRWCCGSSRRRRGRGLRRPRPGDRPAWYLPGPEAIEFPTGTDRTAGARAGLPADERPTTPRRRRTAAADGRRARRADGAARSAALNAEVQYWTSRGLRVVDVDYGGSHRLRARVPRALHGPWGVVDVDDCVAGARFLADAGEVDPARLAIRGGSAGGYTTLAALTRPDASPPAPATSASPTSARWPRRPTSSSRGTSTGWSARWPEGADLYDERSPINHVDGWSCPLLLLPGRRGRGRPARPGGGDRRGAAGKGVPHAYLLFAGEQHGFRKAENIRAALDGELSFYAQVWGFDLPADEGITPITIR